jgi:hypothetical protein
MLSDALEDRRLGTTTLVAVDARRRFTVRAPAFLALAARLAHPSGTAGRVPTTLRAANALHRSHPGARAHLVHLASGWPTAGLRQRLSRCLGADGHEVDGDSSGSDSCSGDSSDDSSDDSCTGNSDSSSDSGGCSKNDGYDGDTCTGNSHSSAQPTRSSSAALRSDGAPHGQRPRRVHLSLLTLLAAALALPLRRSRALRF